VEIDDDDDDSFRGGIPGPARAAAAAVVVADESSSDNLLSISPADFFVNVTASIPSPRRDERCDPSS
jgi:hypothetical protein